MSVRHHHEDEELIALLDRADGKVAKDEHLQSCDTCGDSLVAYRSMMNALAEDSVWNGREVSTEPVPATIAKLRSFAASSRSQDALAESLIKDLLAGPRYEWLPRLKANPKFRSAGVVRQLFSASDAAALRSPADDLELTKLSTEIADNLEPSRYSADEIARLRGSAWRDRAYALNYAGDSAAALDALAISESHFAAVAISDYEKGRLELTRALVYRALDRIDEGLQSVRIARRIFTDTGDGMRLRLTKSVEAYLLYKRGDLRKALQLWSELEREVGDDEKMLASIVQNVAIAYRDLGEFDPALHYYRRAAELQSKAGNAADLVKIRWGVAQILVRQQRYQEAEPMLHDVMASFADLQMREDVILARLDLAELLTIQQRFDEVIALCQEAIDELRRTRLEHTIRALTAVSYLHEATLARKSNPGLVRRVRDFVDEVRRRPSVVFAPPPL